MMNALQSFIYTTYTASTIFNHSFKLADLWGYIAAFSDHISSFFYSERIYYNK